MRRQVTSGCEATSFGILSASLMLAWAIPSSAEIVELAPDSLERSKILLEAELEEFPVSDSVGVIESESESGRGRFEITISADSDTDSDLEPGVDPKHDDEFGRDRRRKDSWRHRGDLEADVVRFGQDILIDEDRVVEGSVFVINGDAEIEGSVLGDAIALGGDIYVREGAVVEGAVGAIGGRVITEPGAVILDGDFSVPVYVTVSDFMPAPTGLSGFTLNLFVTGMIFLFAVMGALLMEMLFPDRTAGIAEVVRSRIWPSFFAGLAMNIAFLPIFILLMITIVGIPVAVLLPFALVVASVAGYIAVAVAIGVQIVSGDLSMRGDRLRGVMIGLAVFLGFLLIADVLSNFAGPAGWLGSTLSLFAVAGNWTVGTVGLGAVLVSRFGSKRSRDGSDPGGRSSDPREGMPVTPPPAPIDPRETPILYWY